MLGLAVLFVMAIYFVILFFVTRFCYKKAINKGKTRKIAFLFGLLGFSLVFLPVFWDFIPNRIYFNDLCKNDTKLQVYKTFDEWNAENPGVIDTLYPLSFDEQNKRRKNMQKTRMINGDMYEISHLNKRITLYKKFEPLSFHIGKQTMLMFDEKAEEVLAKQNAFYSGPGNVLELGGSGFKIWLNGKCDYSFDKTNNIFAFRGNFGFLEK